MSSLLTVRQNATIYKVHTKELYFQFITPHQSISWQLYVAVVTAILGAHKHKTALSRSNTLFPTSMNTPQWQRASSSNQNIRSHSNHSWNFEFPSGFCHLLLLQSKTHSLPVSWSGFWMEALSLFLPVPWFGTMCCMCQYTHIKPC